MTKSWLFILIIALSIVGECSAGTPELWDKFGSSVVNRNITVSLDKDQDKDILLYYPDNQVSRLNKIEDDMLFSINNKDNISNIVVFVDNFNPLTQYYNVNDEVSSDRVNDYSAFAEKLGVVTKMLSKFSTSQPALAAVPEAAVPVAAAAVPATEQMKQTKFIEDIKATVKPNDSVDAGANKLVAVIEQQCLTDSCNKLKCYYRRIIDLIDTKDINPIQDMKGILKADDEGDFFPDQASMIEASKLSKIRKILEEKIKTIEIRKKAISDAKVSLNQMIYLKGPSDACGSKLDTPDIALTALFGDVTNAADEYYDSALKIYNSLVTSVDTGSKTTCRWMKRDPRAKIMSYGCNIRNIKTNDIHVTKISIGSYTFDNNKIGKNEIASSKVKIYIRPKYYIDVKLAGIYTGLSIPKYGTKSVGGQTVVAKAKDEKQDFNAALMMNAYSSSTQSEYFAPFLQFGLAYTETNPALLFGGGFSINKYAKFLPFEVSGGLLLAWAKDLNSLQVGSPVSGTADIDSDLKTKLFTTWYVALQLKFD